MCFWDVGLGSFMINFSGLWRALNIVLKIMNVTSFYLVRDLKYRKVNNCSFSFSCFMHLVYDTKKADIFSPHPVQAS